MQNKMNVWTALACAALLWLAAPTMAAESVVAGLSVERLDRLDELLEREIGAGRLSGMVVAVARHGEVIQRTYGYMNLETREKMRDDALFRLYSMTKPVTSVALLTLYEQGLFHLTDPLDKYIATRWGCRAAWVIPMSTQCTAQWDSVCSISSR